MSLFVTEMNTQLIMGWNNEPHSNCELLIFLKFWKVINTVIILIIKKGGNLNIAIPLTKGHFFEVNDEKNDRKDMTSRV